MSRRLDGVGRDHLDQRGKPKRRLNRRSAQALAQRTGMNAYKCGTCDCWHVGRNHDQIEADHGHRRRHGGTT